MTQNEIIEMARQARLMSEYDEASPWVEDHEITQYVEAFAKLVAAKEREACADLLEHGCIDDEGHHLQYAKEIRASGEQA
jgi:hypothetical protein